MTEGIQSEPAYPTQPTSPTEFRESGAKLHVMGHRGTIGFDPVADARIKETVPPLHPSDLQSSRALAGRVAPGFDKTTTQRLDQLARVVFAVATTENKPYQMSSFGASQNPVAKLEESIMIPTNRLSQPLSIKRTRNEIIKALSDLLNHIDDQGGYQNPAFLDSYRDKLSPEDQMTFWQESNDATPGDLFDKILEMANTESHIDDILSKAIGELEKQSEQPIFFRAFTERLQELKTEFSKTSIQVDPSRIQTKFYEKESIIANLKAIIIDTQSDTDHLKTLIDEIEKMPQYVALSEIFLPDDISSEQITKNLPEYVSSTEISAKYPEVNISQALKDSNLAGPEGIKAFAFKMGPENDREILVGKLNDILGFNPFLVPKKQISFEKAELTGLQSPTGIVSEWLEGTMIDSKTWGEYNISKAKLAHAEYKKIDTDRLRQAVQLNAKKVVEQTRTSDATGIFYQSLMNLLLQSYDSHKNQFIFVDGQAYGFDEGRFLAPKLAYTRMTENGEETFIALRAAILNHPSLEAPIPEIICESILNSDLEGQLQTLNDSGLVGGREDFNQWAEQKARLIDDFTTINTIFETDTPSIDDTEELEELCDDYNVELDEEDIANTCQKLVSEINGQLQPLLKRAFGKVHPDAAEGLIKRARLTKQYIQECQDSKSPPTMEGLMNQLYPELTTIFHVLQRFDTNPYDNVGFKYGNQGLERRSLESVIKEAKRKKLASKQEIQQMEISLEYLKKNACTTDELSLTMDLQ